MDKALPIAGEISHAVNRLHGNMAIAYEDINNYDKAFELFRSTYDISLELFGADHPKTKQKVSVLRENRYSRMAQQAGLTVP